MPRKPRKQKPTNAPLLDWLQQQPEQGTDSASWMQDLMPDSTKDLRYASVVPIGISMRTEWLTAQV